MYPHQSIASFHPTSNDRLCGTHVAHILQNQIIDPWRSQIIQADQDWCTRMENGSK